MKAPPNARTREARWKSSERLVGVVGVGLGVGVVVEREEVTGGEE